MDTIIGIAGKAESGKDTAAGFITAVWPRTYYRRAFADALKREALYVWVSKGNGRYTTAEVLAMPDEDMLEAADKTKATSEEFRTLLQNCGIYRRAFDPNHWIMRLAADHERSGETRALVIPDVRFQNEARWVLDMGGIILRLERPSHMNKLTTAQRVHQSETDLDRWEPSESYRIIKNDGDPVHLLRAVLAALRGEVA